MRTGEELAKAPSRSTLVPSGMSLLVVQGPQISPDAGPELLRLSGATSVVQPRPGVLHLEAPKTREGIAEACQRLGLDFAFLDRIRRLSEFRLLAFDMDSTLITIECIDEIADFAGVKPQVAAVTEAAMRGELDFPSALRRRVALLKGLPEDTLRRVFEERLRLSPGAKTLLETAQRAGLKTLLVSGGFTYFVERLGRELGIDHTHANQLEFDGGHLTGQVLGDIVDATAKATTLTSVCAQLGCSTREAVVFGDGANDLKMMALGGFSVAFRAKPVVRQQATAALNVCGLDGVLNWIEP